MVISPLPRMQMAVSRQARLISVYNHLEPKANCKEEKCQMRE